MKQLKSNQILRRLPMFLFCCVLLLSSITAFGQSTTDGAIGGTVVDPQGKAVPGASVVVRNNSTMEEFKATTDSIGYFRVGHLQPAEYAVTIQGEGFAAFKAEKVIVTVGSLTAMTPHLKVGTSETVDVSAEAPLVNVTSADFTQTLNSTAIENLPINGGRWSSFAMLTPGVVSDSNGFGLISVRGMSPLLNNVTVDGADNNQAYFSEERGRTRAGYSTAKVAVQEFQVNTSDYTTEYGRAAGAVINTVTKSGGNQIHGEAFWEDRDNAWGSMNPYTMLSSFNPDTQTVTTSHYKPQDVRKMGGFGIGGPLIKDRLFWFVAFDRYHHNFPGTAVPTTPAFFAVPDAALPTGVTCGGSGAAAPSTQDANVCSLASYAGKSYADARALWMNDMFGNSTALGLISDTGTVARTGDQDIFFPKLDWIINNKNHASFEVNRMRWWSPAGIQTQATNNYGAGTFGNDYVRDTWGVAKLDTAITSRINNQLRFQFGRDFEVETNQTPTAYDAANLIGSSNPYGIAPTVSLSNITIGSTVYGNRIQYPNEYKTQIADTVSMQRGRHNIKFGIDWMHSDDTIQNLWQQYGQYSFNGVPQYFEALYAAANPAAGLTPSYTSYAQGFQGSSASNPAQAYEFATNDFALFFQDDWKLTPRLTVNLGLRYETELMPSPISDLETPITLGTQNITLGKMPNNPQSIGPRVGFAWDMFGDGKTVLRGGYGMFFGRVINSAIFSAMTETGNISSPLSEPGYSIKNNVKGCSPAFPTVLSDAPTCPGSVSMDYFDPNFKLPQIHEVNLTLQREIGWHTVLSATYLGSFGHHSQSFTDMNLADPGSSYCTNGTYGSQTGVTKPDGSCPTGYNLLTPPSTISYAVSNQVSGNSVSGMPLPSSYALTMPFYTSRVNYQYGAVIENASSINSNYHALVIQLEKRLSNHVQFAANYTWSHAIDDGVNGTTGSSSYASYIDPKNPKYGEYGNSNYNVPNRFTFNAVFDSPWRTEGWKKYLVEGWEASPVLQMQNGLPYSLATAGYYPTEYVGTQPYEGIYGMNGSDGSFVVPGFRNVYKQPSTYVFDLRLAKQVTIAERYKLEFTADGFNLFNHQNVTGMTNLSSGSIAAYTGSTAKPATGTSSSVITNPVLGPYNYLGAAGSQYSTFGIPNNANSNFVYGTRQIQLGARVTF